MELVQQMVLIQVNDQLLCHNMIKKLGDEWQVGHRPVVLHGVWVKVGFLEQGFDDSSLETLWHNTRLKVFIDELHNDRHSITIFVGTGSNVE